MIEIKPNALYTKQDIQNLLGHGKTQTQELFKNAKVYGKSKTYLILGSELIDYIRSKSE